MKKEKCPLKVGDLIRFSTLDTQFLVSSVYVIRKIIFARGKYYIYFLTKKTMCGFAYGHSDNSFEKIR